MGQKVNPNGFRLGVNKDWKSKWYANKKDFADTLIRDIKIRDYIKKNIKNAAIANVVIERTSKRTTVKIFSARPGMIIGQGGKDIEKLKQNIKRVIGEDVYIQIVEIKNPDINAQLVADQIASQIENRASLRNVQKRAIRNAMKAGAKGIKTKVSGRLNGAEIARSDFYTEGTVPLHTLRADIDYATSTAMTTYGKIGVKVWIYKGEILGMNSAESSEKENNKQNKKSTFKPKVKNDKGGKAYVDAKEN